MPSGMPSFNTDDGIWRATIQQHQRQQFHFPSVSIPMTVFGGLQSRLEVLRPLRPASFNTDDGIWRATIMAALNHPGLEFSFQYR